MSYEVDDYLLVDGEGQVQAVSGNSEFFDIPIAAPNLPSGEYYIVKVEEVLNHISKADVGGGG
jgi:hypothetical protein